ncbi:hypothetical protein Gotur_027591 [Gossypium turneri]
MVKTDNSVSKLVSQRTANRDRLCIHIHRIIDLSSSSLKVSIVFAVMGNCLRHQKKSSWVVDNDDDDWQAMVSAHGEGGDNGGGISITEEERLLGGGGKRGDVQNTSREVKITISKKELEQLVKKVELQGLTLEQFLSRVVNGGADLYEMEEQPPRPWKPMLQSIPE